MLCVATVTGTVVVTMMIVMVPVNVTTLCPFQYLITVIDQHTWEAPGS